VSERITDSLGKDGSTAEGDSAGCLIAVLLPSLQFLGGNLYHAGRYLLGGQGRDDRQLEVAAAVLATCLERPGLSLPDLAPAVRATCPDATDEDLAAAVQRLRRLELLERSLWLTPTDPASDLVLRPR
jgi:hypothetical protein